MSESKVIEDFFNECLGSDQKFADFCGLSPLYFKCFAWQDMLRALVVHWCSSEYTTKRPTSRDYPLGRIREGSQINVHESDCMGRITDSAHHSKGAILRILASLSEKTRVKFKVEHLDDFCLFTFNHEMSRAGIAMENIGLKITNKHVIWAAWPMFSVTSGEDFSMTLRGR